MTRKAFWAALAATAALATGTPAGAQTTPRTYSNLFVFGDSLVDSGNAQIGRALAGGEDPAPSSAGYVQGRFSNGYNFADWLSRGMYGAPTTASGRGGLNFSVGGAQASEVTGDASPSFLEQIASFRTSGKVLSGDSLVLVTLGGNDVRRELGRFGTIPGYQTEIKSTTDALTNGFAELVALGARNFVITGVPDIGQIPAVTGLGSAALIRKGQALSVELNYGDQQDADRDLATDDLQDLVADLNTGGVSAQFFDLFAFQQQLYADPVAYDLSSPLNTRTPCIGTSAAPTCNGFVYFDPVHPTSQVHRAISIGIARQIGVAAVPEPASWLLMIGGAGAIGASLRRRRTAVANPLAA